MLHFSEDPTITRFAPRVARTARQPQPYVWAVDAARAPDYWFPRPCPRAMVWTGPGATLEDRERLIGPGGGNAGGLGCSGIRLRNAKPAPPDPRPAG